MCGIAGRLNFRSGAPVDAAELGSMCDLLAHRGPDAAGVWCDGPVGFGHRRLAIIDLSDAGRQPMQTADGQLIISFNGELYNYRELRGELAAHGHEFRTQTDTEVLLVAYRQWGDDFLTRLNGMFALAIWDRPRRRLLLARDRVGKKPLYYREDQDGVEFASEPKAFLADARFDPRVDVAAIHHYLTYQYVPVPESAFQGVRRLRAGHSLVVENGQLSERSYWRLRYQPKWRGTETEARAELEARLRAAVERRLMSDVPLGAFLSGGIDSGTIVALMAQLGGRVETFSIGFEDDAYNELPFAQLVAERYGTNHHAFVVRPDAVSVLPQLVWHYNEPYADSSALPTWYLSELTRRHVTVALNGDGGDESFAGYDRYLAVRLAEPYDRVPQALRSAATGLWRRLPAPRRSRTMWARCYRFGQSMDRSARQRYAQWMMHLSDAVKREVCTPDFLAAAPEPGDALLLRAYASSDARDLVDATMDVDVRTYLPDDLLVKVDIASMAHGLEARSPLLDVEVMEFAASLPIEWKLHGRTKKYLLKQLAADLLPAPILRRPKMGFGVPLEEWFRRGALRELASDVLLDARARQRGYFRPDAVERLLREHADGQRSWHYPLWNLLMLELWHRTFIDRRPSAPPAAIRSDLAHA